MLTLKRTHLSDDKRGVFGELYLNGRFICWTLENKEKSIPCGRYLVKNSQSPKFKRELPLIYSSNPFNHSLNVGLSGFK